MTPSPGWGQSRAAAPREYRDARTIGCGPIRTIERSMCCLHDRARPCLPTPRLSPPRPAIELDSLIRLPFVSEHSLREPMAAEDAGNGARRAEPEASERQHVVTPEERDRPTRHGADEQSE